MIRLIFSRRWLFATVLVLAAIAVMARLGIWQLDRLEKRRAFNARVEEQQNETLLQLEPLQLEADFYNMEYRRVSAMGTYLPEEEIILRNQSWEGELGFQLFTPLLIEGSQKAILVQRGWIPGDKSSETARQAFREEGIVEVHGVLRRAETDFGLQFRPDPTLTAGEDRLDAWNNLSLERIQSQVSFEMLPVYLQRVPTERENEAPIAQVLSLELNEGPHLGYAGQWFLFAATLAIGYPIFVLRQEQGRINNSES